MAISTNGNGTGVTFWEGLGKQATHLFGLNLLIKGYHEVATAREINALAESTTKYGYQGDKGNNTKDGEALLVVRHELEVGVLERNAVTQRRLEGQVLPLFAIKHLSVDDTRKEYGREERNYNTDNQCRGKAADRTGTKVIKDRTRDNGGQVRVDDGTEGIAITCVQGLAQTLASLHLFLCTFIDKHIGIHGHTQRQHHTCDTAQCESCLETGKDTYSEEEVEQQGTVGYHTGDEAIHGHHVEHQDNEGQYCTVDTHANGFSTQRRTNDFLTYDMSGSRHLTRLQHIRQVLGLFGSEATGDFRTTTINLALYIRSAIYIIVKDDGNATTDVQLGQLSPTTCAVDIHLHIDTRTAIVVKGIARISDNITLQRSTSIALCHADSIEIIVIGTIFVIDTLNTPLQTQVVGKSGLGLGSFEEGRDGLQIALMGNTHNTTLRRLHLQAGQQRMLLQGLLVVS